MIVPVHLPEKVSLNSFIFPNILLKILKVRITVSAQLDIWAGVQKYQLGVNLSIKSEDKLEWLTFGGIQSEAELEWLAHELSDWLGMEITR